MNPALERLHPYPFERLAALLAGVVPPEGSPPIAMSIGEPQHPPPSFVLDALSAALGQLGRYPQTQGLPELRRACAGWLERRYRLGAAAIDPESMVLPVSGTREALFAFAQAVVDAGKRPLVALPNPCYQIYEGAALLSGAEPLYLPCLSANGWLPDLDTVPAADWQRCQLLYLCSPGNPTGAVMGLGYLRRALELAERYDFIIAGDECYADIYLGADPPAGLLQACLAAGRSGFQRCVVFHSLSKRSSVPGLRSGFVAGDPEILAAFRRYRTYHGCALPLPAQLASVAAWNDDAHAAANRSLYRAKFDAVLPVLRPVLEVERPAGAFYLWPAVDGGDEAFARGLFASHNVTVLPGSYLARGQGGANPGQGRVRMSLVANLADCVEAAGRIRDFISKR